MRDQRRRRGRHRLIPTAIVRASVAALVLWIGAATLSAAQAPPPRTAEEQQALLDLAFALGRTHYLRTLCRGEDDQTWRTRMTRMVEVEAPDEPFRLAMVARFNDGWLDLRADHRECGTAARDAATSAAQAAAMLADRLSSGR